MRAGQGRATDYFISSLGVRRSFWQQMSPDRRYNSGSYDGGWETIKFSHGDRDIQWFADELAPRYTLFGIHTQTRPAPQGKKVNKVQDEEQLALFEAVPPDWDDASGSELKQIYSGAQFVDAVGAFLRWYLDFGTCRPNTHFRLDDLRES